MQTLTPVHDTLSRRLAVAPDGLGVGSTVHVVPVRRSASVTWVPAPFVNDPTAMHDVVAGHDTASSSGAVPVGSIGLSSVQIEPSQDSVRRCWLLPSMKKPTAVHAFTVGHDTPWSRAEVSPLTAGVTV